MVHLGHVMEKITAAARAQPSVVPYPAVGQSVPWRGLRLCRRLGDHLCRCHRLISVAMSHASDRVLTLISTHRTEIGPLELEKSDRFPDSDQWGLLARRQGRGTRIHFSPMLRVC